MSPSDALIADLTVVLAGENSEALIEFGSALVRNDATVTRNAKDLFRDSSRGGHVASYFVALLGNEFVSPFAASAR